MANKIVLYKLIPFGNGFIAPSEVVNGGTIWDENENIHEIVLCGECDAAFVKDPSNFPEGIIKVVTKTARTKQLNKGADDNLKEFKRKCFEQETDPLFTEAIRKKEMGNTIPWNNYIHLVKKIENLKSLPLFGMLGHDVNDKKDKAPMNLFPKSLIRQVMREMKIETKLNALIKSSTAIKHAWNESNIFDLSSDEAIVALKNAKIDVKKIKAILIKKMELI